jgi:hypothetical protein
MILIFQGCATTQGQRSWYEIKAYNYMVNYKYIRSMTLTKVTLDWP